MARRMASLGPIRKLYFQSVHTSVNAARVAACATSKWRTYLLASRGLSAQPAAVGPRSECLWTDPAVTVGPNAAAGSNCLAGRRRGHTVQGDGRKLNRPGEWFG